MISGSANLNVMITAARRAARGLLRDFGEVEKLQVSVKGPGDFVSRADTRAEATLRKALTEARPNYGWLAEESDPVPGKDPTRRWIVDPLDGTTNFLHGLPHWAVSIALEHKGEVIAGVIHDPVKDETFAAEKGHGAYMNDQRLRVSARARLDGALFGTGLPFGARRDMATTLQDLARLLPVTAGVRRMGSASLDLAYVAAGRLDGFWERGLQPWDIAAGLVILREAGGLAESIRPDGDPMTDGDLIAANGAIFERFAKLIRNDG
jgi:myo-inositol-1(or 4)-monophosphatase